MLTVTGKPLKQFKKEILSAFKVESTKQLKKLLSRCWSKLGVPKEYPITKKGIIDLRSKISWRCISKAIENFGENFSELVDAIHDRFNIKAKEKRGRKKKGFLDSSDEIDPNFIYQPPQENKKENQEEEEEEEFPRNLTWIVEEEMAYVDIFPDGIKKSEDDKQIATAIYIGSNNRGKLEKILRKFKKLQSVFKEIKPGHLPECFIGKKWELRLMGVGFSLEELMDIIKRESKRQEKDPEKKKVQQEFLSKEKQDGKEYHNFNIFLYNGRQILTRFCLDWGGNISHLEFRGTNKKRLPISPSNYSSHFIFHDKKEILSIGLEKYAHAYFYALYEQKDDLNEQKDDPSLEEVKQQLEKLNQQLEEVK